MAPNQVPKRADKELSHQITSPLISLLKNRGSIYAIVNNFVTHPGTDTGWMTAPITTITGYSFFSLQLLLPYDFASAKNTLGSIEVSRFYTVLPNIVKEHPHNHRDENDDNQSVFPASSDGLSMKLARTKVLPFSTSANLRIATIADPTQGQDCNLVTKVV